MCFIITSILDLMKCRHVYVCVLGRVAFLYFLVCMSQRYEKLGESEVFVFS